MKIWFKNTEQKKSVITFLAVLIIVPLLSWYAFRDSLKLDLEGDTWLLLYTTRMIFEVQKSLTFFNPRAYLCTYCPPYTILTIIKHFWGYNAYYYFLISLIIRIGISYSLYFIISKISKSKLIGLLASLFFAVNYIGIQTTDWVFNHNHYLGIILVIFFIYWYLKLKTNFGIKTLALSGLFFLGGLIVSPPRMHGVFPLLVIVELAWRFIDGKKYSIIKGVLRLVYILFLYKLLFTLARGGYGTNMYFDLIKNSVNSIVGFLKNGDTTFILNPLISLGNYIIPDMLWTKISVLGSSMLGVNFRLTNLTIILFAITSILTTRLLWLTKLLIKKIIMYLFSLSLWIAVVLFFRRTNLTNFSNEHAFYSLVGGFAIIFSLWLFFAIKKKFPDLAMTLIIAISWMFTFNIFPWLLSPSTYLVSWMRYSVQQSVGLSIWAATILSLSIFLNYKRSSWIKFFPNLSLLTTFFIIMIFTVMHITYTRAHFSNLVNHRNNILDQNIWATIKSDVPQIDHSRTTIFYLTYDDYYTAEWVLRFGFSSRASIMYEINNPKAVPTMIYDYNDLLSFVTDGKALSKYGIYSQIIPIENVYAFDLKNGQLTNTTSKTREKLLRDTEAIFQKN